MGATSNARLGRIGNSTGLTLSREVLDAAGLERGAEVRVEAEPGRIVVTPGDCREFRVCSVMMGMREVPHGATERATDT